MSKSTDRELAEKLGRFRDGKRIPWFTLDRLLEIYREVGCNSIVCTAGCHECCKAGTEVSAMEQMLMEMYCAYKGYSVFTRGSIKGKCPYISESGMCKIHPVRPLMCRAFGLVDHPHLRCQIGIKCQKTPFGYEDMRKLFLEVQYQEGKALKVPTGAELEIAMVRLIILDGKEPVKNEG